MKIDWKAWSTGQKLMAGAAVVALVAFFLPWTKPHPRALRTVTGFSEGWTLLGLLFLFIPLIQLMRGKPMGKVAAAVMGGLAVAIGIVFVATATFETSVGSVNVSQWGSYVYIVACLAFTAGPFIGD